MELESSPDMRKVCHGPLWNYDDFDQCHRQRYFELFPLAAFLVISIAYTALRVVQYLLSGPQRALSDEELAGSLVLQPKDNPDEYARIVLRTRSIGDRLRIMAELLLNVVQAALVYKLTSNPTYLDRYSEFAPQVPQALTALAGYVLLLSLYRFVCAKKVEKLVASPFKQEAYIYTVLWLIYGVNRFSYINHSYSHTVTRLTSVLLAVATINWLILFTSPIGDEAARLYTVQDPKTPPTIPSTEPISSLLTIMSCNWCLDLIRQAQRKPLNGEDVLELSENDHAYSFLKRFRSLPEKWSFLSHLVVTLRKPLALNLFFGLSAAVLKLTPTIFIQRILEFLEYRAVPDSVGWLYVLCLGFTYLLGNVCGNQAFYQGRKLSLGVRSIVIGSVYRKALFQRVSKTNQAADAEKQDDNAEGQSIDQPAEESSDDDDSLELDSSNTGAVINLMSVDSFKIADFSAYLHDVPAVPLLVLISIVFLYSVIGWSAFAALGVMLAMMPINVYTAKRLNNIQQKLMGVTDRRVEKTNELIDAIRIVKFYAWERQFTDKVLAIREEELNLLLWRYVFWIFNGFLFFMIPIIVVVTSFWCFVRYQGGVLTTPVAFTALSVFDIMRVPLNDLAYIFTDLSSSIVSLRRIQTYLNSDETTKYEQLEYSDEADTIGFENASFAWEKSAAKRGQSNFADDVFKLRDINVKFATGDLNVIVGPTGSGKTSLLLALLGEMKKEEGHVFLPGGDRRTAQVDENTGFANTIAYCSQEAWLVNDTIKKNILFAHKFDRKRYNEVIDACELRRDLEILDKGDQTLIGDKGISLSGGQKQRVSIARAIYSNSRHLILDDCLSAVDAHTAGALYDNALNGPLARNRTIILVSHNVALTIGKAATVTVLGNGNVVAHGTPAEVASSGHLGNDDLVSRNAQSAAVSRTQSVTNLAQMTKVVDEVAQPPVSSSTVPVVVEEDVEDAALEEEERATGSISLETYTKFLKEFVNAKELSLALFLLALVAVFEYLQSWWVKLWAASSELDNKVGAFEIVKGAVLPHIRGGTSMHAFNWAPQSKKPNEDVLANLRFYSIGYIIIGLCGTTSALLRELIVYYGGLRASRRIFKKLLLSITHAKTRFHDTTPSGRIVNRFSKDMEVIDQEIIANLLWFGISIIDGLQVTIVVCYVTPIMIPLVIVLGYFFLMIGKAYLAAARELKRIESVTRSPIFQQFGETLAGSVVIRAYGDTERFISTNLKSVDQTHRPYFWLWVSNRWLSFWSSMMSLFICVLAATFIVANADTIDPGFAGISLSFSSYLGDCILWILRMYASCEISMNSVERVTEYLEVDQEAQGIIPESRPPTGWPSKGEISFKNLSLQYADDLPMVIKNVSFDVPHGYKVGIVGRTGAGKSTIITALFRMLEPASGSIVIDDVDISTIGLEDLRNGLAIIPQDPTLFKGSLRSNLDMFDEHSDAQIFKALAHAHLVPEGTTPESIREEVTEDSDNNEAENKNPFFDLERQVEEGGRNFSQGQRQLLCLARAILKEPRILLLDEATASIDYDTDALIQETIRESFGNSTILTIAHRLRTIVDYDLILVLEKGEVAQLAHPYDLLQDKEGIFYGMCQKSGEFDSLMSLAKSAKERKK